MARKNAKSAVIAAYLLGRLVGPLRTAGYRAGVVSVTREKAGELWLQAKAIAEASGLMAVPGLTFRSVLRSIESQSGTVDILSADKASGHASGFDDAIVDELGLLHERDRDLVAGMRSATAAKNGRFLALSTRGDGPFIPEILKRVPDPDLAVHLYEGDPELELDDPLRDLPGGSGRSGGYRQRVDGSVGKPAAEGAGWLAGCGEGGRSNAAA